VPSSDNGAVPEGNLQIAREGYEVLNRGDVDRFLTEFIHPDYEFHTGVRVPSIPTVVRGRDGLRAWIQQWYQEPWEGQLQMEVERMEELMTVGFSRSSSCAQVVAKAAPASRPSTHTSSRCATGSAFGSMVSPAGSRPYRLPGWANRGTAVPRVGASASGAKRSLRRRDA
jgi:hypothetical protein